MIVVLVESTILREQVTIEQKDDRKGYKRGCQRDPTGEGQKAEEHDLRSDEPEEHVVDFERVIKELSERVRGPVYLVDTFARMVLPVPFQRQGANQPEHVTLVCRLRAEGDDTFDHTARTVQKPEHYLDRKQHAQVESKLGKEFIDVHLVDVQLHDVEQTTNHPRFEQGNSLSQNEHSRICKHQRTRLAGIAPASCSQMEYWHFKKSLVEQSVHSWVPQEPTCALHSRQ